jgi:hypothetical protein
MRGPWYLFLDESGDLGFGSDKPGRSKHFTICILAIRTDTNHRNIAHAIRKTIARKLNPKTKRGRIVQEIKGSRTVIGVKEYFFRMVTGIHFGIYALTLNKERLFPHLQENKEVVYNYLSRLLLEQLPFENADISVHLVLDKRKSKPLIREFNQYVERALRHKLALNVLLRITHEDSKANPCLQAVDLFCHGIYKKYESGDSIWYDIFKGKVRYEDIYLPPKKESVPYKP